MKQVNFAEEAFPKEESQDSQSNSSSQGNKSPPPKPKRAPLKKQSQVWLDILNFGPKKSDTAVQNHLNAQSNAIFESLQKQFGDQNNNSKSSSSDEDYAAMNPMSFEEQYEKMVKKQLGGYVKDYVKLSKINPYKADPFIPENPQDLHIKKTKQNSLMLDTVSEFRNKFAEMASLPKPFRVLKVQELPQKPSKIKQYDEIIYYKEYIWDLPIVGVEVEQNKGLLRNVNLEVVGSNHGIFMNPQMIVEPLDEKFRGVFHSEPEEVFIGRDSYPEKFYDDYWMEGVDDLNNQEVDIVVDQIAELMQGFDQVRGGVQLEMQGEDPLEFSKIFNKSEHNEDVREGPEYARDLMNNHNNQIELLRLQEGLSDHDLTLIEYDSKIQGGRVSKIIKQPRAITSYLFDKKTSMVQPRRSISSGKLMIKSIQGEGPRARRGGVMFMNNDLESINDSSSLNSPNKIKQLFKSTISKGSTYTNLGRSEVLQPVKTVPKSMQNRKMQKQQQLARAGHQLLFSHQEPHFRQHTHPEKKDLKIVQANRQKLQNYDQFSMYDRGGSSSSNLNRRSGMNVGQSKSPKVNQQQQTPYENIHIMIKHSKAMHAANAGKTRTSTNFKQSITVSSTQAGGNGPQPLQIYGLNQPDEESPKQQFKYGDSSSVVALAKGFFPPSKQLNLRGGENVMVVRQHQNSKNRQLLKNQSHPSQLGGENVSTTDNTFFGTQKIMYKNGPSSNDFTSSNLMIMSESFHKTNKQHHVAPYHHATATLPHIQKRLPLTQSAKKTPSHKAGPLMPIEAVTIGGAGPKQQGAKSSMGKTSRMQKGGVALANVPDAQQMHKQTVFPTIVVNSTVHNAPNKRQINHY